MVVKSIEKKESCEREWGMVANASLGVPEGIWTEILHTVSREDPWGVRLARVKDLGLGKLKEQKESQVGWRSGKEQEGGRKEGRQDSGQGCVYEQPRRL